MQFLLEKISHYWQLRLLAVVAGVVLIAYAVMMPVHSTESAVGATLPSASRSVESPLAQPDAVRPHTVIQTNAADSKSGNERAAANSDGLWLGENPAAARQLTQLARWYREEGLPHDFSDLVRGLRGPAEGGDAVAQFLLGEVYERGLGVPRDVNATAQWYERAVAARSAVAFGTVPAAGPANLSEALKACRQAAEQGVVTAEFYRGVEYDLGLNVARNPAEAIRWYRKAALNGSASAANNLGVLYHRGDGIARDSAEAKLWLGRAAAEGSPFAQYSLGRLYLDGEGVSRDSALAAVWLQKAARGGSAAAEVLLSLMSATGDGVKGDNARAYMWINLASAADPSVSASRDAVEKEMSAQELAEGQKLTRAWLSDKAQISR